MAERTAIIFDFGNVVAHFDYARSCEVLGEPHGLSGTHLLEKAKGAGLTPLVRRYERGELSDEEFSRETCRLLGVEVPHSEFETAWADIFWPNEPVARLVAALKGAGHPLVLGSNTNAIHADQFRRQFAGTLAHFDRLVLSFEIGHCKPSADFYLACARAADREPGDCLFIDDLEENIQGAREIGMPGIHYDPSQHGALLDELERRGIAVPRESPCPER